MKYNQFVERLQKAKTPVVVDFWATWCMPCRVIEPVVHKLEEEYSGQVEVWKVNADENQDVLRSLQVYSIPTVMAFRDGKEIDRMVGVQPQSKFERLFHLALGEEVVEQKAGVSAQSRLFRLLAGVALIVIGWLMGQSLILYALGAIVVFSAFYDRCPIYQTVAPRVKAALKKVMADPKTSS